MGKLYLSKDYIIKKINISETVGVYFVNSRINNFENSISLKLNEIESILKQSMQSEVVYTNDFLKSNKNTYTNYLKEYFKKSQIYFMDRFNLKDFYVPPILSRIEEESEISSNADETELEEEKPYDDWKHLFERSNTVYITGGAGYGKTLLMQKLILDYEELNIPDAGEYIIIYGELKKFFKNDSTDPISVIEFLKDCMKRETMLDDSIISTELISYYLKSGRCIILLDALDEVDKDLRQSLHSHLVNFLKFQNRNNKICITSRARGFIPEKEIEIFQIEPLKKRQIRRYIDNIIKLEQFDTNDKESFLRQAMVLVKKKFLNSFLMLSLLTYIYKAERELPENKLELYQKCFEYISYKREGKKSLKNYDWKLLKTLLKENTFTELANLCLPNNKEVNGDEIKATLTQTYKTMYISENQTENAVDQFLLFCAERTELFVPASGENCFKFFHRSFFEYFYSQYIFTRMTSAEEVFNAWRAFDIDSEVFELTIALYKQKNQRKYQELVEYLMKKLDDSSDEIDERRYVFNVLVLCMQIIDDELYTKRFVDYLVENVEFCLGLADDVRHDIITKVIKSNCNYIDMVLYKYGEFAEYLIVYKVFSLINNLVNRFKRYYEGWDRHDTQALLSYYKTLGIFMGTNNAGKEVFEFVLMREPDIIEEPYSRISTVIYNKFYISTYCLKNSVYQLFGDMSGINVDKMIEKLKTVNGYYKKDIIFKGYNYYCSYIKHFNIVQYKKSFIYGGRYLHIPSHLNVVSV